LLVTLLAGALVAAEWDAMAHTPRTPKAGAVDQILTSLPDLISLRIGLIAVVAFVVSSVLALTFRGRWLIKIGPAGAEAEPETSELLDSNMEILDRLDNIEASVAELWEGLDVIDAELRSEDGED
jgi:hypothetical protein